jgi:hypothetical protein
MNDANLTAHAEMKNLIERQYQWASKQMNDTANLLVGNLVKAWEDKGGCKACNGLGRVLTWSTLDGESYDEFGPCTACTDATRAVGAHPLACAPRGSRSTGMRGVLVVAMEVFTQEMNAVSEQYNDARINREKCITNEIVRGDYIIVVKGRKIPTGNHGMVVAVTHGSYGPRVGFIDGAGQLTWIALTNVERCLGMDGAARSPAIEAFIKNDNDYRTSKKLPLKKHDAVAMMMAMC